MGNVTVAEDGNVQFCCYSPAIVGNVNAAPFAAIWNGATMRRLRETLHRQEFPPECRTPTCPVFRGDERHFILERTRGPKGAASRAEEDARVSAIRRLAGTRIVLSAEVVRHGEPVAVGLAIATTLDVPTRVDLVVALLSPDAPARFLPDLGEVPAPLATDLDLPLGSPRTIALFEGAVPAGLEPGDHELIAAMFLPESNPCVAANCLLATRSKLRVLADAAPSPAAARSSGPRR
jgi:hypothetical protein